MDGVWRLAKESRWNKSMQQMTLNCIGPFTGYRRTQVCTICIHFYIFILWRKVFLKNKIYILVKKKTVKGWLCWQAVNPRYLGPTCALQVCLFLLPLCHKQLQTVRGGVMNLHQHTLTHTHTPQEFVVVGHITSLRHDFEVDGFFNNSFGLRTLLK